MNWRKVCPEMLDFPEVGKDVLISLGDNMYTAYLVVIPAYSAGKKRVVDFPEQKFFRVNQYDYSECCRTKDEINLSQRHCYWTELPKGPDYAVRD